MLINNSLIHDLVKMSHSHEDTPLVVHDLHSSHTTCISCTMACHGVWDLYIQGCNVLPRAEEVH